MKKVKKIALTLMACIMLIGAITVNSQPADAAQLNADICPDCYGRGTEQYNLIALNCYYGHMLFWYICDDCGHEYASCRQGHRDVLRP